jgi:hypothetical protein
MPPRVQLDYRAIGEIMRSQPVRRALRERAEPIAERARALARSDGLDELAEAIRIEDGTRPRGRPYSQVVIDHPDGEIYEFGTTKTEARRLLGRAADVEIF